MESVPFHQTKAALSRSIRTPKRCHSLWWIHISWVVSKHASTAPPFHDISRGSMSCNVYRSTHSAHTAWLCVTTQCVCVCFVTFGLVIISTLSTSLLNEGGILLMMRWSRNSCAPWNMSPPPTTKMELYIFRLVSSDAVKQKSGWKRPHSLENETTMWLEVTSFCSAHFSLLPQQSMLCRMALSRPRALLSNWFMMAFFLERWADGGSSPSPAATIRPSPWAGPTSISPHCLPPGAALAPESSPTPPWLLISPSRPPPALNTAFLSAADLEDWKKKQV